MREKVLIKDVLEKQSNEMIAADNAPEFEDGWHSGGLLVHEKLEGVEDGHPEGQHLTE